MLGLSLPVDIPWKRMASSSDMMVRAPYNGVLPRRWRSSITIFGYEPGPDYQIYDGQLVSYVKICASITGFQPDPNEVGINPRSTWKDPAIIEEYDKAVSAYYGCYGAILEVAVTPGGPDDEVAKIALEDYPYLADFEPKKRELYELVTDTGEVMSRSLESVNVRKGTTTTEGEERVDSLGYGGSIKASAPIDGKAAVSGEAGINASQSSKNMSSEEVANVRTTDSGRESRETYSHTTQITQMYHQLDSYHLGSNRALFYLLPRPHIVQTEHTFVNGPRMLEGVQEFFLVVMRPASMASICVDAYLETAHLSPLTKLTYEQSAGLAELHLFQPAPKPDTGVFRNDDATASQSGATTFTPPDGWEIDVDHGGKKGTSGYQIEAVSATPGPGNVMNISCTREYATISGTVQASFDDKGNKSVDGRLDVSLTVFIRKKMPTVSVEDQTLYLTGRSVSTCKSANKPEDGYIAWEGPLKQTGGHRPGLATSLLEANSLRADISSTILESVNHKDRYAPGTVRFADSQVIAHVVGKVMEAPAHPDNRPLNTIPGLDAILKKIGAAAAKLDSAEFLRKNLNQLASQYGLTLEQVRAVRRAVLGIDAKK